MEKRQFIYRIEAEPNFNILSRILSRFARWRIRIDSLQATRAPEQPQHIVISVCDEREKNIKLSRKIETEIDVLSVTLFEQTP